MSMLSPLLALAVTACVGEKGILDSASPAAVEGVGDRDSARGGEGEGEGEGEATIDPTEPGVSTWFPDADGDGFGSAVGEPSLLPWASPGFVASSDDCDDADASVHPGAAESCDDQDEDCDGEIDEEASDAAIWHPDADGDGFGASYESATSCEAPDGYLDDASDCDDADAATHPGVEETCGDDEDNDCDGEIDEVPPEYDDWRYPDWDSDDYGDDDGVLPACTAPATYIETGGDCDDRDPSAYPGAREVCGGVDYDCDGLVDSDDPDTSSSWYWDRDGDGYGDESTKFKVSGCDAPAGAVEVDGDCDDSDSAISPDATETCGDEVDENCDTIASDCEFWGDHDISEVAIAYVSTVTQHLGWPVTAAGDVDGDGLQDLWVGATGAAAGGSSRGTTYLVLGGEEAGDIEDVATASLLGETDNGRAGWRIEYANDVDGDGYDDVWLGSPYDLHDDGYVGSASLFLGPHLGGRTLSEADLNWIGQDEYDQAGYSVAAGADLDGDGTRDVVIASIWRECCVDRNGEVDVIYQDAIWGSRDLASADIRIQGEESGDNLGRNVEMADDLSGDGTPDLLIGSTASDAGGVTSGAVYVLSDVLERGTYDVYDVTQRIVGDAMQALGDGLSAVGDMNGDGYEDLAVGASGESTLAPDAGAVFLFHGPVDDIDASADAITTILGTLESGNHTVVDGGEDLDADGSPDLVTGAWYNGGGGTLPGTAYLFHGPIAEGTISSDDADALFIGSEEDCSTARSVAMAGDTNGDGYGDLIVGASGTGEVYGEAEGTAWLLLGEPFE